MAEGTGTRTALIGEAYCWLQRAPKISVKPNNDITAQRFPNALTVARKKVSTVNASLGRSLVVNNILKSV